MNNILLNEKLSINAVIDDIKDNLNNYFYNTVFQKPNVVILTTPTATQARLDNIKEQKRILGPHFNVEIQEDTFNSGTRNHLLALTKANQNGVVVLEDDAIVHPSLPDAINIKIRFMPFKMYSFFTPKTRPQQFQQEIKQAIARIKPGQLYALDTLVSGLGYYIPNKSIIDDMIKIAINQKMISPEFVPHKNLTKNADFTIGKLFKAASTGEPIMYFHPSLVQHLNKGQESQVWVSGSHATQDRSAHLYIGDIK